MKKFILLIYMFLLKISKSTLTSSYIFMYPYEVIKLFFFVWGGWVWFIICCCVDDRVATYNQSMPGT